MPYNLKIYRRPLKYPTFNDKTIAIPNVNVYLIKSLHNVSRSLRVYDNVLINKNTILKEVKKKSGIYRRVNKLSDKCYIGSSVNLTEPHAFFSLFIN